MTTFIPIPGPVERIPPAGLRTDEEPAAQRSPLPPS